MSVELLDMELLLQAHAEGTAAVEGLNVTLGDSAAVMERLSAVGEQMTAALQGALVEVRGLAAEQGKLAASTDAAAAASSKLDERLAAQNATLATHRTRTSESAASLGALGDKAKLVSAAVGVGLAAAVYESVKAAGEFQAKMALIHTQAGAWDEDTAKMGAAVLKMAGEVGQSALALADGLYHIESAGFRGGLALDMLRESAKLAKIGNAGLEESSQAVVAVLAAFGEKTYTASQAAALLNSVVGSGDMRMSQLAKALATGVLPAADVFGLKLLDVGSALATLTDNVTPADEAATRLRMSFSLLGAPSGAAAKALQAVGLSADEAQKALADRKGLEKYGIHLEQLAADMHKPNGLLVAITDLKSHLESAGLTADAQAAVISKAFGGGRTSAGIMTLLTQYDRFKGKYGQIEQGASKYDDSWTQTKDTFEFQKASLESSLGSLSISIGMLLLPILQQVFKAIAEQIVPALERFVQAITPILQQVQKWAASHQQLVAMLVVGALVFAGLVVGLMAVGGAVLLVGAAFAFLLSPAGLVLLAVLALAAGALFVISHWKQIEPVVKAVTKVWTDHSAQVMAVLKPFWAECQKLFRQATAEVLKVVLEALATLQKWWAAHGADVIQVVHNFWDVVHGIFDAVLPVILALVRTYLTFLVDFIKLTWSLVIDIIRLAWDIISGIISIGLDLLLGHWDRAWADARQMVFSVWEDIKRLVGDAIGNVLGLLSHFVDNAGSAARALGDALRSGIVGGLDQILEKIHGFIDLIRKLPGLGSFPQVPTKLAQGGVLGAQASAGGAGQLSFFADGGVLPIGPGFRTSGAVAVVGEGDGHEYVIPAGDPRMRSNAVNLWLQAGRDLQMLAAGGVLEACCPAPLQLGAGGVGSAPQYGAAAGSVGGWGGQCVVYAERVLGTYWPVAYASQLSRYVNSNVAKPGEAAVFTGGPYGHVAVVTGTGDGYSFPVVDSNWVGPETIGVHTMNRGMYGFSGFIDTGKPLGTLAGMVGGALSSVFNIGGLIDGVSKGFHLDGLPSWLGSFPQEILSRLVSGAKNDFTPDFGGSNAGAVVSFDQGGWLMPGTGMYYNGTGGPELVLSPPQNDQLTAMMADVLRIKGMVDSGVMAREALYDPASPYVAAGLVTPDSYVGAYPTPQNSVRGHINFDPYAGGQAGASGPLVDLLTRIELVLLSSNRHLAHIDGAPTIDAAAAARRSA